MNEFQKIVALCALVLILFTGCGSRRTGALTFTANGEDFVRRGFVDKQGWHIAFDSLLVNCVDITAYNAKANLSVTLPGAHLIDLASGDENAEPIKTGFVENVPVGNYQSLAFRLKRAVSGPYPGYSIVMIGTASREGREVPFTIKLDEEMLFDGREGFVGDQIKGVVKENDTAEVEMTFHFDHVFGDSEAAPDDHINTGSVGFGFFDAGIGKGVVDIDQAHLKKREQYETFVRALWTLGHLGEGHCEVSETSTTL